MNTSRFVVFLLLAAVCSAASSPKRTRQTTSTEASDDEVYTYRPPQYIKPGKAGGGSVVKKFVKINRVNKEESLATSLAKSATTSLQYNSQSFVATANGRPASSAYPTQLPLTTAARLTAAAATRAPVTAGTFTSVPSTIRTSAPTTTTTTTTTALPFRRALRTSGSGNRYFASGSRQHDSQPQASLLKKSYSTNQFEEDEDADDYFSRRRARFLFKSRVGK